MPLVKVSTNKAFPQQNQTPGALLSPPLHQWGDFTYVINDDSLREADYWLVYNDLQHDEEYCHVAPSNTIFIPEEPPAYRFYNRRFQRQFGHLYSCHLHQNHPNHHLGHQYLQWYIGSGWEAERGPTPDFKLVTDLPLRLADKKPLVSIMATRKSIIAGHRHRQIFLEKAKAHFKDKLVILGGGQNFIAKWDALAPYYYHIAIENSVFPHYWSEKIADSYLAWTMPIYAGAPNVREYFPDNSLLSFDLKDWQSAQNAIEQALDSTWTEERTMAIAEARRRILYEYNLMALIPSKYQSSLMAEKRPVALRSHRSFDDLLVIGRRQLFKIMRRMDTEWRP